MVQDTLDFDEPSGGISIPAIVATAAAAGVIAFLIRRARQKHEPEPAPESPLEAIADLIEEVQGAGSDFRSQTAAATRDLLVGRILPELKPILLDLLGDVRKYVDEGFRKLEGAIRAL